jgi:hypothetical protein
LIFKTGAYLSRLKLPPQVTPGLAYIEAFGNPWLQRPKVRTQYMHVLQVFFIALLQLKGECHGLAVEMRAWNSRIGLKQGL